MRFCRLFQTLRHIPPKQLFWQVFRFFFNKSPSKKIYKFHFSARSLRVVSSSYSKVDDNNVFIFGSKLKIISSKLPSDIKQDYLYDFSYNYLDFIFINKKNKNETSILYFVSYLLLFNPIQTTGSFFSSWNGGIYWFLTFLIIKNILDNTKLKKNV